MKNTYFRDLYEPAIKRARHPLGAKVANNTRVRREAEGLVVRLHKTDIIRIKPDDSITLHMEGWNTITTRQRLNDFSTRYGVNVGCHKGQAFVWRCGDWDNMIPFKDGIRIYPNGKITGGGTVSSVEREAKLRKQVRAYAKLYMKALVAGKIPAPSGGDCWFCALRDVNSGQPMGRDPDHILSHISAKERYFVPSLLANANDRKVFPQANVSQAMLWALGGFWHPDAAEREKAKGWQRDFILKGLEKNLVKWIEANLKGTVGKGQSWQSKPLRRETVQS